ncbi:serine protease [Cylindrospermopsis raciborskii]|uniref:S1 family peptidase n=1 Tax=Cylindrospermopsis raciborskii TaxID=77022 RepID=UPI0022C0F865|nr:serine protease [Cylindrospermopsis raciborskii]MCZ2207726.1 serine protease [Cylindrospermopsis raciborskii PAMP2011]
MAWYRNKALGYMVKMVTASLIGVSLIILAKATIIDGCTSSSCSILLPNISDKTEKEIEDIAQQITVRISAPGSVQSLIGSGTIIRDGSPENYSYRVITNSHVLRSAKGPYTIHTPDGKVYIGKVSLLHNRFKEDDIAILNFDANKTVYEGGKINRESLQLDEKVFVGGFITEREKRYRFIFTSGKISLLLKKPLLGGYQIGYTNKVRKGMSGAPVLNTRGEVVGINGLQSEPLWQAQELYQDGEKPDSETEKLIVSSSMAVPMRDQWGK